MKKLLALLLGMGLPPAVVLAFELIEFEIDVVIQDPVYVWDYSDISGALNTGFTIDNLLSAPLQIQSSFIPGPSLLEGEDLQPDFVLTDGTLFLSVNSTDPEGARARIRTTYRMDVDPRMLGRDQVRARIRAQLGIDPRQVRAARLADARIMRFVTRDDGGTWIRAGRAFARAAGGRAEARFMGRRLLDDTIGHYGYFTKSDGTSYVWAVGDRNSRYAVGLNLLDRDGDGVLTSEDNCPDVPNSDQLNADADLLGNACDDDDDNDGIEDDQDNCPLTENVGQDDLDGDGIGDACDADDDNDGVNDGLDSCPATEADAVVNPDGCSITDLCDCLTQWKNHGAYVRCVAHASEDLLDLGLITSAEKDEIVSIAGNSACGKRQ